MGVIESIFRLLGSHCYQLLIQIKRIVKGELPETFRKYQMPSRDQSGFYSGFCLWASPLRAIETMMEITLPENVQALKENKCP